MDDKTIIELYWSRNEQAIAETDTKYGSFLQRVALNILSLVQDAEECVNDTYHAAWNKMPPEEPLSLRAFLGRIVRNLSISRYRSNHAEKRYAGMELMLSELEECIPAKESVEDIVEHKLEAEKLTAAMETWLNSLPQEDSALFLRRYWYGDAIKDLAKEWGTTPNLLAQRMLRLRKKLKVHLETQELLHTQHHSATVEEKL